MVALAKSGDVYTFGMNNKGQCGRDFPGKKEGASGAVEGNKGSLDSSVGASASSVSVDDPATSDHDIDTENQGKNKSFIIVA